MKRTRIEAGISPSAPTNDNNKQFIDDLASSIDFTNNTIQQLTGLLNSSTGTDETKALLSAALTSAMASLRCLQHLQQNNSQNAAEEQERRRSVVIIGLPESTKVKPSDKCREDNERVETILDELGVQAIPSAIYRMGRPRDLTNSGPRLLKCTFPASVFQRITLGSCGRNRQRIRAMDGLGRVIIRPSLTLAQREAEKQALAARRALSSGTDPGAAVLNANGPNPFPPTVSLLSKNG